MGNIGEISFPPRSCEPAEAVSTRASDRPAFPIDRFLQTADSKLFLVSTAAVGLMSIPIVVDVIARLIFSNSVPGIIELEEFFMVIIVFLSLAHTQRTEGHIVIDLLTCKLKPRTARLLETFNNLTCFLFFILVGWRMVLTAVKKCGECSVMLSIPAWIPISLSALGIFLLSLVLLGQFLSRIRDNISDRAYLGLILVFTGAILLATAPFWIKALPWHLSRMQYGVAGMAFMLFLLLLGMPIGFAMGLVGFIGLSVLGFNLSPALNSIGISPYTTAASFIMAVVPLFILMGLLASEAGISQELFDTAYKWLGRFPGGLALAAIAGCAGFAAVCGDSMATAVTMGSVSLPEMEKKKYSPGLACGALAAGGTLGILIPPSVGFIFYAIVTEESVGKLFIAGIVPGLLLALAFIACLWVIASVRPELAPRGEAVPFKEKLHSLKGVIGMFFLFLLILGGILMGVFSPTEGGAVGVAGAFIIALIRRKLTLDNFLLACKKTVHITGKLMMILIGVGILGYFLAASQLPFGLASMITEAGLSKYLVLTGIIGLYIILGCLMNVIPMILLTLPALFPTVKALGFDPIWFGVLTVMIMEMGQITPPIGVNVFALSSVAKGVPMGRIFIGIIPFFLCIILMMLVLIFYPPLATGLVDLLF